jgi:hypothetical protein
VEIVLFVFFFAISIASFITGPAVAKALMNNGSSKTLSLVISIIIVCAIIIGGITSCSKIAEVIQDREKYDAIVFHNIRINIPITFEKSDYNSDETKSVSYSKTVEDAFESYRISILGSEVSARDEYEAIVSEYSDGIDFDGNPVSPDQERVSDKGDWNNEHFSGYRVVVCEDDHIDAYVYFPYNGDTYELNYTLWAFADYDPFMYEYNPSIDDLDDMADILKALRPNK